MTNLFANNTMTFEAGQTGSGVAAQQRLLRVISGRIWLTIEGENQDYWLEAGDAVKILPRRLIVLAAEGNASRVESICAAPETMPDSPRAQTWAALRRWLLDRLGVKTALPKTCS